MPTFIRLTIASNSSPIHFNTAMISAITLTNPTTPNATVLLSDRNGYSVAETPDEILALIDTAEEESACRDLNRMMCS